jgi:hypothetical protein
MTRRGPGDECRTVLPRVRLGEVREMPSAAPIKFRCYQCHRLLGAARSKVGTAVTCPQCATGLIVPEASEGTEEPAQAPTVSSSGIREPVVVPWDRPIVDEPSSLEEPGFPPIRIDPVSLRPEPPTRPRPAPREKANSPPMTMPSFVVPPDPPATMTGRPGGRIAGLAEDPTRAPGRAGLAAPPGDDAGRDREAIGRGVAQGRGRPLVAPGVARNPLGVRRGAPDGTVRVGPRHHGVVPVVAGAVRPEISAPGDNQIASRQSSKYKRGARSSVTPISPLLIPFRNHCTPLTGPGVCHSRRTSAKCPELSHRAILRPVSFRGPGSRPHLILDHPAPAYR